jgi:1-acyl-sn-glycerol-3-phosphate acyltransferase
MNSRHRGLGGRPLSAESPLLGGPVASASETAVGVPADASAGAEDSRGPRPSYDPRHDAYVTPPEPAPPRAHLPDLRALLPATDEERSLDDWGRSERVFSLVEPALNFYYRYWFRVETEGIENVPSSGGALLVSNHSGALPPDAPMVMQAIRNEHPEPRPLYMLGEHWFKGYPGVGMLANKVGLVAAHRENAQRLLYDEGRLAIVFPEGQKGSRKLFWQRYRLRRFGRGGFVRTAIRARVPIVPLAVVGAEEAMPIFAHLRFMQRLSGLVYFPLNHAFPHFGLAAGLMYLPAKFKIRFLEPLDMSEYPPETADDPAEVQTIAERIRTRIQLELDEMLGERRSVWFG